MTSDNMDHRRLRQAIRDPRGHELEIGLALKDLTDADLGWLGHGSLALVRAVLPTRSEGPRASRPRTGSADS